jgi:EpsI family protein
MNALKGLPVKVLALLLSMQAVAYYALASRSEIVPDVRPLSAFPAAFGPWTMTQDFPIEPETQAVLKADDTVTREYAQTTTHDVAGLFIAFFKTQRFGQAPHSPKNCLPGSGWQPTDDRKLPVTVPGRDTPIVVNKYVVERGEHKSVVLYWYQSHSRAIASEYTAKFWLVVDAIRYRRSDTALVRVIVPVRGAVADSERTAIEFVQSMYPDLARQLPQ